ncbi:hypothetical protein Pcinc_040932 [Petrolisthes cinctipes]|uniref:Neuroparsin n=1 Tax=Petrolisthes cinctipes TaxID=88211 RepID=A0AAE1BKK9_PETCI|nr:hypothetical protein Pcinc_040932 [Petrolisthes cinctipes]
MKSYTSAVTILLVASCCLLLLLQEGSAAPRCPLEPETNPEGCKYGVTVDWCHNEVCAKGPGESCGGYRNANGECGEGTFCQCNICYGCSPFDNTCETPPIMNSC